MDINMQLNPTAFLNDNIDKLIETFIMYYGENHREEIKEKFSKFMFIGHQKPDVYNYTLKDEKKRVSKLIVKSVVEKYNDTDIQNILIEDTLSLDYDFYNISPNKKLIDFFKLYKTDSNIRKNNKLKERYNSVKLFIPELKYEDFINKNISDDQMNRVPEFFKGNFNFDTLDRDFNSKFDTAIEILNKIIPDINKNNFDEYYNNGKLDFIEKIIIAVEEAKKEYDEYVDNNLRKYIDEVERLKKIKTQLKKENMFQLINEFSFVFKNNEFELLEQQKDDEYFTISSFPGIEIFFGIDIEFDSIIHFFNSESDELLLDTKTNEFKKNLIKENRIKYFKYIGFDYGDDYEKYISDSEVIKKWPSKELVNQIDDRKKYYLNKYNLDYYGSITSYKEIKKEVDSLNLLDKDISFNPSMYINNLTCVNPNLVYKDGKYDLFSLVIIYAGLTEYDDVRLIHELNHLFELSLINVDEKNNRYEMVSGWDNISGSINQSEDIEVDTINLETQTREYELFSEIINEMIAQDITTMMHDTNIYIFNTKENAKIRYGTGYENTIQLAREFFNTYKDEIIASRSNNNIQIIFDTVGKENFDRLNSLFHKFNDNFAGFKFYNLMNDIKNNKETEATKYYYDLLNERDKILASMKEYNSSKSI